MELDRYYELRTLLQRWLRRLADNIRNRIEVNNTSLQRLEMLYDQEGVGEEFTLWLDRWCRQAAIQFILRILFLRVLEDRNLLGTIRLRSSDGQQMWQQLTRNLGAAHYVQWCSWDAAHLLPDLFGPTDYDLVLPGDELAQQFLDDVWRRPDANRADWLRYDFRPDPTQRDGGFQTRFIGDLYQELDAEIRERYALLQTPHFISQFILEHTLLKRFQEKDFREVTLIDPTCGSAHFLVDAFWLFVAEYERMLGKSRNQLSAHKRAEIARTIIEKHLYGCDINPYATALARFRLLLAACDYAQPVSLQDLRDLHFNIMTIDSLIPYEKAILTTFHAGSEMAKAYGQRELIERALPILSKRYDTVVGNPPYILAQDASKREIYRQYYQSAHGKFGLSAPFTERFFIFANQDGYVGLINSNAFARRQFGTKLIEEILPHFDLQTVIDLSGAYIPGHGTPTLILFGRNRLPLENEITMISNIKGEHGIPTNPINGKVWQSLLKGIKHQSNYTDEYIDVASCSRYVMSKHPWQFGGPKNRLYEKLSNRCANLKDVVNSIGITLFTLTDEVFSFTKDFARRKNFELKYLKYMILGENLRDWIIKDPPVTIFPYESDFSPADLEEDSYIYKYLNTYRTILEKTILFGGKTKVDCGYKWYEYGRLTISKYLEPKMIALAEISTHNHAMFSCDDSQLFNRTAQVIKLGKNQSNSEYLSLTGMLNSSLTCFSFKQVCFNKGTGEEPVRDRYVYAGTSIGLIPIPHQYFNHPMLKRLLMLVEEQHSLAQKISDLTMANLFVRDGEAYAAWYSQLSAVNTSTKSDRISFTTARQLEDARDWNIALHEDVRSRMIFVQEELDWLVYEIYELAEQVPQADGYLTQKEFENARLQIGQRAFELAGKEYRGDWLVDYQSDPLPDYLRPLSAARMALIQANPDIALLEDPLYKRRWVSPDYTKEFRDAAEWWLAEKLEYAIEHHNRPITIRQWAQLLRNDERVNATLEVLTGSPMFDLEEELRKVIEANAVPNRPEHYLKATGLRKLAVEEAEFKSADFSDSTAWRLRGKLNIPRERFIAYREFDHSRRGVDAPNSGGPWYGWAGWDVVQRAEALAHLLDQANRAGWEVNYRQCGLRAALRDLLPALHTALSADEVLEFRGIAELCGMGTETRCYCRAYREGVAALDQLYPGAPGVTAEAVSNLAAPATQKKRKVNSKARSQPSTEQWALDLIDNPDEQAENEE